MSLRCTALALIPALAVAMQAPSTSARPLEALRLGDPELAMTRVERRVRHRDATLQVTAVAVDGSLECRRSRSEHDRIDRCEVKLAMVVSAEGRPRGRASVECTATLQARPGGTGDAMERPTATRERSVTLSQGRGRTLLTLNLTAATAAGWEAVTLHGLACRLPRITLF